MFRYRVSSVSTAVGIVISNIIILGRNREIESEASLFTSTFALRGGL